MKRLGRKVGIGHLQSSVKAGALGVLPKAILANRRK